MDARPKAPTKRSKEGLLEISRETSSVSVGDGLRELVAAIAGTVDEVIGEVFV